MQNINSANTGQLHLRYHSKVWPLLLITVGVVWLLQSTGILPGIHFGLLLRLWPLLLIVIGVELLVGSRQPRFATLFAIGAVALALAVLFIGPAFGFGKVDVKTGSYTEAAGNATSARVEISPAVSKLNVSSLEDSSNLFDATVNYLGTVNYNVSGDKDKIVTLGQNNADGLSFLDSFNNVDLDWKVGLSPTVPTELHVNTGVGETVLNLTKLHLTDLSVDAGIGKVTVNLPETEARYNVRINCGVGEVEATVPEGAQVNMMLDGGTGNVTVNVPSGAAIRVVVKSGLGNVNLPSSFTRTNSGSNNNDGTWETTNFNSATRQIVINYNGGVGNFSLR